MSETVYLSNDESIEPARDAHTCRRRRGAYSLRLLRACMRESLTAPCRRGNRLWVHPTRRIRNVRGMQWASHRLSQRAFSCVDGLSLRRHCVAGTRRKRSPICIARTASRAPKQDKGRISPMTRLHRFASSVGSCALTRIQTRRFFARRFCVFARVFLTRGHTCAYAPANASAAQDASLFHLRRIFANGNE